MTDIYRKCQQCGCLVDSNFHSYCPTCKAARIQGQQKRKLTLQMDRRKQQAMAVALEENKQIKIENKVKYQAKTKQIMTDAEQLVIEKRCAKRNIETPLQDPRSRMIARGAEWLWRTA
jgi:CRISPR/Cas system-associated endonuclease Cas3-HD